MIAAVATTLALTGNMAGHLSYAVARRRQRGLSKTGENCRESGETVRNATYPHETPGRCLKSPAMGHAVIGRPA